MPDPPLGRRRIKRRTNPQETLPRPEVASGGGAPEEHALTASPSLVWLRQDLRLSDQPALAAALARGGPVAMVYVLDDETPGRWAMGGASRWWLGRSLGALQADIAARGGRLILRRGAGEQVIPAIAAEIGAGAVYWSRRYEPFAVAADTRLKTALRAAGLICESFNSALLAEPWAVRNGAGEPFKVFTPFWRAARQGLTVPPAIPAPSRLPPAPAAAGDDLAAWGLAPVKPDWAGGLRDAWSPGEAGAHARLTAFLDEGLAGYAEGRNAPGRPSTSRLSPFLHFGEISPWAVWRAAAAWEAAHAQSADKFLAELGWREFSHHLLHHFPGLPERNWRPAFDAFPWRTDEAALKAWRRGRTGFPIVDAGLRELWTTGWMHNRVRMITASFLIKDLMIDWRAGEDWFWDTLVDADLAQNAASWQWVAGSGADAAPFFRVFNPVMQGAKFDPDGAYVRRFIPELARLPDAFIHAPWTAPALVLAEAGVRLGRDYPAPIVDHDAARKAALAAFETIKQAA